MQDLWLRPVEHRHRSAAVLHVAIEIAALEIKKLIGVLADLVGGAVVDLEGA